MVQCVLLWCGVGCPGAMWVCGAVRCGLCSVGYCGEVKIV